MVEFERYKGQNIICLRKTAEDRFPFSFGYKKAKLILDHYADIVAFVKSEEAKIEVPPESH